MPELEEDTVTELPEKEAVEVTPLTQKDAAADIEDILGDDLEHAPNPGGKDGKADKADDEDEDPLGLSTAEDVDKTDDEDNKDGSAAADAGKYVSPRAKYKLADGSEITIGDLARDHLYQRDYTFKTQELEREKEASKAEVEKASQLARTVSEEREFLIWFAERHVPKQPAAPSGDDPMGEIEYGRQLRAYQEMVGAWQQFKFGQQQSTEQQKSETVKQTEARQRKEVQTIIDKIPMLKDGKKADAFFTALVDGGSKHYGLTREEIANAAKTDHRMILALRDAIAMRNAREKAPAIQKELAKKPVTVRGSAQRGAQQQMDSRSKRNTTEELRKNPTMRNGIAAIEALIS